MGAYFTRRAVSALSFMFIVSIISFTLIQLPEGDYATNFKAQAITLGGMSNDEAELMAQELRTQLGLDKSYPVQYWNWITGIITEGDFGLSFVHQKPVAELINERIWRTLGIAITCHLLATLLGVSLGIYAALNQHRLGDTAATVFSFLGMTIPRFFMALLILYILAFVVQSPNIGSLNSSGYILEPMSLAKFWDMLLHIWPIILVASIGGLAYNLRVMRGNLLDVLRQPFIETALAKGLPRSVVMVKHAVPNALHPLIMYQGIIMPYMLAGELEIAIILAVPTIGPLLMDSLVQQDIYVTATILLMLSFVLVIGNLLADIILSLVDPRIRLGGQS